MSDFDLKSADTRVLECAKCDEPVSGVVSGARITLTCGYCGFEDVRELTATRAAEGDATPYRGKKGKEARALRVDLAQPLEGVPGRATLAEVRALFLEQKKKLAAGVPDDERASEEFRLVWLAATLAAHQIAGRDFLHARAGLEAAAEAVTTPVYRGLLLARLARLAALSNAQELGERWLAACPKGLRVAELTSDVRVADAMLARARGDAKGVLESIGERDTADEFVGGARWLAVALRVDAHEKLGQGMLARQLWRQASRGNAMILANTAAAYGLARQTRKRIQTAALFALPALGVAVYGIFAAVHTMVEGDAVSPGSIAMIILGLAATIAALRM
jgi:hypothetical protein